MSTYRSLCSLSAFLACVYSPVSPALALSLLKKSLLRKNKRLQQHKHKSKNKHKSDLEPQPGDEEFDKNDPNSYRSLTSAETTFRKKSACAADYVRTFYNPLPSGFRIAEAERSQVDSLGGDSTYGEILPDSLAQILWLMHIGPDDVFYDLGSGIGKTVIQAAMTTPAKKVVGVEVADSRFSVAEKALQTLKKDVAQRTKDEQIVALQQQLAVLKATGVSEDERNKAANGNAMPMASEVTDQLTAAGKRNDANAAKCGYVKDNDLLRGTKPVAFANLGGSGATEQFSMYSGATEKNMDKVKFLNEDFTKVNMQDATVIFSATVLYQPALLAKICNNLGPNVKQFASMSVLELVPECDRRLCLLYHTELPMSWGDTPVRVYRMKQSKTYGDKFCKTSHVAGPGGILMQMPESDPIPVSYWGGKHSAEFVQQEKMLEREAYPS
ncbi:unnamed protein product [Amoebophrya sp. A120]|nr:unnamed protein product [Amoebophrya sp. A120]|eukprot:GSA120T00012950001.1